jgi:hypothetical protein
MAVWPHFCTVFNVGTILDQKPDNLIASLEASLQGEQYIEIVTFLNNKSLPM